MPTRKLPDNDQLLKWLDDGKTHEQIRQLVKETTGEDVSAVSVRVAIHRLGAADRRPRYDEWLPWTISARHNKQYPAVMLRAYARYQEAGSLDALPEDLRVRLCNWLADMEGTKTRPRRVVTYDAINGFGYDKAKAGEDIIRRPEPKRPPGQRQSA